MRRRTSRFNTPDNPFAMQQTLTPLGAYHPYSSDPYATRIHTNEGIDSILNEAQTQGRLGVDWEFGTVTRGSNNRKYSPTVLGIASRTRSAAVPWSNELAARVFRAAFSGTKLVAHAGITADKPVIDQALGVDSPLSWWEDSLIEYYCDHHDFTQSPLKEGDDDGGGSMGLMNLFTAANFYLGLPNYKFCRGNWCIDQPCPTCLRGETLVYLENGTAERIAKLVLSQYSGKVLCVDPEGRVVARPVTNWYASPRGDRDFYRVSYDNSTRLNGRLGGAVVTEDHTFLTARGYIRADCLVSGEDLVATGTSGFTDHQKKVLVGILLGDSHLTKSGELTISHCDKQKGYLNCKENLFFSLLKRNDFSPAKNGSTDHHTACFRITPAFKDLANRFKDSWRKYLEENFTIESLGIWYLDDGNYHAYQMSISVRSYSLEERQFLCDLILRKTELVCKPSNGGTLKFNSENSQKLSKLISKMTPSCMRYKLHPNATLDSFDTDFYKNQTGSVFYSPVRVEASQPRINWNNGNEVDNTVYCIGVEEFNNFVTRGGVVHNCSIYDYCATDAWSGVGISEAATASMRERKIPESLVTHVTRVTDICYKMEVRGVNIDRKKLKEVNLKLETKKEDIFPFERRGKSGKRIVYTGPFNPNSSQQVIEYFSRNGVNLESKDKQVVYKELRRQCKDLGHAIVSPADLLDISDEDLGDALTNLKKLYLYQTAGKGGKSWFDDKYFDPTGVIHPRFIPTGTCTGRLSSSKPNFQNIPSKRTFGAEIRKLIIPFNPDNIIIKADYSSLELAVCLWYAGGPKPSSNFFLELVASKQSLFDTAVKYNPQMSQRDISKSVVHASNYAEGFSVLTPEELRRRENEVTTGALVAYDGICRPSWNFRDGVVCFTGGNLSERLFGSRTRENRRLANELREAYLAFVPEILAWQIGVSKQIEDTGFIQSITGRRLDLYGTSEEDFKGALAFLGQGTGSDYVQEAMLRNTDIPQLNVHDELVYEVPRNTDVLEYFVFMTSESSRIPGFTCNIKASQGPSWGEQTEIK